MSNQTSNDCMPSWRIIKKKTWSLDLGSGEAAPSDLVFIHKMEKNY